MPTTPTPGGGAFVLPFAGPARPLPIGAIDRASRDLAVEPAALIAVVTVETGNRSGFLPDRRPRILYEAHIAHRLSGRPVMGLSVPVWDRSLYAPTGAGEYERLHRAIEALDYDVACRAASWGLGQILGMNHSLCGFTTVGSFVRAMSEGEEQQLGAMCAFIRSRGLVEAMRRLDWAAFARGYNGPAFRENRYDEKLAAAFARAKAGAGDGKLMTGDTGPEVASLQRALNHQGARITADGDFGRMTRIALERFQAAASLPVSGWADPATAYALGLADAPRGAVQPATVV